MSKQFTAVFVSWRHARKRRVGLLANESSHGRAAAEALELKLNELVEQGWIIDRIIPATGISSFQTAAFTVIAFK